jgi:hypothetical protein
MGRYKQKPIKSPLTTNFCPRCEHENSPNVKFCSSCWLPLDVEVAMDDLRNPEQPEQPSHQPPQQPTEQPKSGVTNIINNYAVPQTIRKFNFASVFTIILTVSLLIIVGLVAWKTGAIQHIIDVFRSLL